MLARRLDQAPLCYRDTEGWYRVLGAGWGHTKNRPQL